MNLRIQKFLFIIVDLRGKIPMKKNQDLWAILVIIILTLIIIMTSNKFFSSSKGERNAKKGISYEVAKVLEVNDEKISKSPLIPKIYIGEQQIKLEILTGQYAHQQFEIKNSMSMLYSVHTKVGMKVIVSFNINENEVVTNLSVYTYKRNSVVYWMIAIFFALLIFIGRLKGLRSVLSIIFSIVVIFYFMIPSIINGFSPVISATISAALIIIVCLVIISGFNTKTYSAILGTICGVIIAGIVSYAFGHIAHLSGLTAEYTENLLDLAQTSKLNIKGLMYAVILISALGAIMDIGISIASAIFEIHSANPKLTKKQLFNSGMNMGKDIIGTMSNTLILAFAGSSFTLLIIIATANMQYIQISNLDVLLLLQYHLPLLFRFYL